MEQLTLGSLFSSKESRANGFGFKWITSGSSGPYVRSTILHGLLYSTYAYRELRRTDSDQRISEGPSQLLHKFGESEMPGLKR